MYIYIYIDACEVYLRLPTCHRLPLRCCIVGQVHDIALILQGVENGKAAPHIQLLSPLLELFTGRQPTTITLKQMECA